MLLEALEFQGLNPDTYEVLRSSMDDDIQLFPGDVDDIPPQVAQHYGFHQQGTPSYGNVRNKIMLPQPASWAPPLNVDIKSLGYAHLSINWVKQWDSDTRERVLIDKLIDQENPTSALIGKLKQKFY
jgi:hypothetical protein